MNCKPGDLAVIARYSPRRGPDEDPYIGAMLRVVSINHEVSARFEGRHTFWNFEPLSPVLLGAPAKTIIDSALRPIRDPGDDAKDEMLRPLPNTLEVA